MTSQLQQIDREIAYWKRERLKLLHPLRQLFWECTLRCNMHCLHCGSDCKTDTITPDMPLEQFLPVLDEIKLHQPHVPMLVNTVGGEPLVRKDIIECGRAITERGFYWGTVSNGYLLDDAMTRALVGAGLRTIAIDVDGPREDHNWLRANPHSFDRALQAITCLQRHPRLTWDVITCVNKRNFRHLEETKRLLIEAGVKKWRCFTIIPMGRAKTRPDMLLTDEEFKELMEFIVRTRREGKIMLNYSCEGYLGDYEGRARTNHFACHAGLTVASILSNGDVSGCLSIRSHYKQGNIFSDGSFWDIWQNRFEKYRDHSWMQTGQCASCDAWHYCQGNGMHLRNDDGSLMLCHLDKLRKAETAAQEETNNK